MKVFTYINNKTGEVLGEVQTNDILVADKVIKETTGFDVVKCPWIECQVKEYADQPASDFGA